MIFFPIWRQLDELKRRRSGMIKVEEPLPFEPKRCHGSIIPFGRTCPWCGPLKEKK